DPSPTSSRPGADVSATGLRERSASAAPPRGSMRSEMFNRTRARHSSSPRRARLAVERLDVKDLQFADELPEGRMVELPGRGTAFVRIASGPRVARPVV